MVPPKVEYALTELGRSLEPILLAMLAWGEDEQRQAERPEASGGQGAVV
jgi:DNA-binding HxlR family transcriptional regulator